MWTSACSSWSRSARAFAEVEAGGCVGGVSERGFLQGRDGFCRLGAGVQGGAGEVERLGAGCAFCERGAGGSEGGRAIAGCEAGSGEVEPDVGVVPHEGGAVEQGGGGCGTTVLELEEGVEIEGRWAVRGPPR